MGINNKPTLFPYIFSRWSYFLLILNIFFIYLCWDKLFSQFLSKMWISLFLQSIDDVPLIIGLQAVERQKVEMAIFFENPFTLNIIIVVRIKITFIECVLASFNFWLDTASVIWEESLRQGISQIRLACGRLSWLLIDEEGYSPLCVITSLGIYNKAS